MTDNATIRAWAAENGYACPARGRIPAGVRILYAHAHPEPEVEVEAAPETEDLGEGDLWVQLNVPGMTQEHEEALCDAILSLIQVAFDAGRHAGRLEMSLRFRAIAEEVES